MISSLTGTIIDMFQSTVTVDVHGVGYAVFTTDQWITKAILGQEYSLKIVTVVRDDAIELYGFDTNQERKLFSLLTTVSGVGPKTALLIMNAGVSAIEQAIATADVSFFNTIPRIGKKNAQKIIIELKSKIGSLADLDLSQSDHSMKDDIVEALVSMGFTKIVVVETLQLSFIPEKSLEENIRLALKTLGKK